MTFLSYFSLNSREFRNYLFSPSSPTDFSMYLNVFVIPMCAFIISDIIVWPYFAESFNFYILTFFVGMFFSFSLPFFFSITRFQDETDELEISYPYVISSIFTFFYGLTVFNFPLSNEASLFYYSANFFELFLFDDFTFGLILLTTFLYASIFSYYKFTTMIPNVFFLLIAFSYYLLIFTFLVSRFFHFYVLFESILLPFFFLISIWGSNLRRIWAAQRLMFFTLFLSSPFFFFIASHFYMTQTFFTFNFSSQYFYFSSSFIEFAMFFFSILFFLGVKVPLFPVHIWLPEAHGEAPTIGSILLAGLLLKLGSYGFYRFFYFSNFSEVYFQEFFFFSYFLCLFSLFASLTSLFFQLDFKKAIAYFSIGHMAYVILGFITFTYEGLIGSFIITLSHGLSATGLFFLVGFLYNQTHTRSFYFYAQLAQKIPYFAVVFFITSLANVSLPGTAGFVGEQLVIFGLTKLSFQLALLPIFFTILAGFTGMIFCFKLLFGSRSSYTFAYSDLSADDQFFSFLLILPVFIVGFFPGLFF